MSDDAVVRVLSLFDEDASVPLSDDETRWVPVRRRMGIGAFGTNAYGARRAGSPVIEEHVESPGQEELYVVLRGKAAFEVGDASMVVVEGDAVFVPDPGARRSAVALEDGSFVGAVGAGAVRVYRGLPGEPLYLARQSMRDGDWAQAAEALEREAGDHLDTAIVRYRLACCHAQAGNPES